MPLTRESLIVGRRPSCDICLDFENISGKHCELRFFNGLWHIRDLGSTNGTTVNGLKIAIEQSLLPDIEVGIAGHYFTVDYEPAGPASVVAASQVMDEDMMETRKRKSPHGARRPGDRRAQEVVSPLEAPRRDRAALGRRGELRRHDARGTPPRPPRSPLVEATDDDFFNLIQEDLGPKKK